METDRQGTGEDRLSMLSCWAGLALLPSGLDTSVHPCFQGFESIQSIRELTGNQLVLGVTHKAQQVSYLISQIKEGKQNGVALMIGWIGKDLKWGNRMSKRGQCEIVTEGMGREDGDGGGGSEGSLMAHNPGIVSKPLHPLLPLSSAALN